MSRTARSFIRFLRRLLCLHRRAVVKETWSFYEHFEDQHSNARTYRCHCPDCGAWYKLRTPVARPACEWSHLDGEHGPGRYRDGLCAGCADI